MKNNKIISFDVLPLMEEQMSGVGYSQAGFLTELLKCHPEHTYIFNFFSFRNHQRKEERLLPYQTEQVRLNRACFPGFFYRCLIIFFPLSYAYFFGREAEITHFFNYIVPPKVCGKTVVTVHDMVIRAFPKTVRWKTRFLLYTGLESSMRRADRIITDSNFSKEEIIKYYPKYKKKIRVVPCGVDCNRFYQLKEKEEIFRVKKKLKITGDYFLYVGNIEPRKNLLRLLKAYQLFLEKYPKAPQLVLAGGKGWINKEIYAWIEKRTWKEKICLTEYVASEDMCALFNGAISFLFPSLYEGFGMPPLEAMACGVPVLVSNEASLPEVVGECGVYVDAYKEQSIADGMEQLYTNESLRQELSKRGLERAKIFTWENAAKKLYHVYKELFDESEKSRESERQDGSETKCVRSK